ncbi:Uncharacterized protein TPAR_06713 [Tolypocladium paradoxum]|uniref:Uncharacterized protein n=1 Tax=Tolypocladium paradoxum TaxID=94208 RepID=A0A2S4KSE6_9HYPO|nr:Uncharacterized protein TPAR_06713 [Tolypocladium paradoxum]
MATIQKLFVEPIKFFAYLRFPAVALTVYLHSVSFGSLYFINVSLEHTFSAAPYSFSSWATGFVFAPASLGFIVASVAGGPWMDRIICKHALKRNRYDENGKLICLPEDRMRENAWLGLLLYPGATIWYGWAAQMKIMWAAVITAHVVRQMSTARSVVAPRFRQLPAHLDVHNHAHRMHAEKVRFGRSH